MLVRNFVCMCTTCQRNKTDQLQPIGLLQPLLMPLTVWVNIGIDFIEGLPKVNGRSVILTIIDRFSKSAHFLQLGHPYTATTVTRVSSTTSSSSTAFMGRFWQELLKLTVINLQFLSAFHPQSNGQSEVTNKIITMYLRFLASDRPREWLRWLPWEKYYYNTSFQPSIRTSPFRISSTRLSTTSGEARFADGGRVAPGPR
jgi:hypothetical protein